MKAILISNAALTAETDNEVILALQAQASTGSYVGVSHDGENHYFCQSNVDYSQAPHIELQYNATEESDNLAELEKQIGSVLVTDSSTLIVGDHSLFAMLFNRPLWQLWCCQHESVEQLVSAFDAVFNGAITLNQSQSLTDLKLKVRSIIKASLSEQ